MALARYFCLVGFGTDSFLSVFEERLFFVGFVDELMEMVIFFCGIALTPSCSYL